jgi:hypothetical protein
MLEELLALGHAGAEYDCWLINIGEGAPVLQRFVSVNPELEDPRPARPQRGPGGAGVRKRLDPVLPAPRSSAPSCRRTAGAAPRRLNWLFWQMGSAPLLGGGFGHFYAYAPIKIKYAIDRYAMEVKRQLHVLDTALASASTSPQRVQHRRHGDLALVRDAGDAERLRASEFLAGARVRELPPLVDRVARAPRGPARQDGQPRPG